MRYAHVPGLPGLLLALAAACTTPLAYDVDDDSAAGEPWIPTDGDGDGWIPPEDCDDANAAVHPGATEYCGGLDDDCDGLVDAEDPSLSEEGARECSVDADGDGMGGGAPSVGCGACPEGWVTDAGDCDDGAPDVYLGAPETCDGRDEDCDGDVDDHLPLHLRPFYRDGDGDGFGALSSGQFESCDPEGVPVDAEYVADDTDCDDGDGGIHPGAPEWCDAVDQDCDGETKDGDSVDAAPWYADADGDGYGVEGEEVRGCTRPLGYAGAAGDCDDGAPGVNPGAGEACGDGVDDDCDGVPDDGC
ncbi:putative metal-binding motif-containing protein [Myxococcota bacterium]|nr:putative metal-binding motif-containing protein [Myxococcota bacterium]